MKLKIAIAIAAFTVAQTPVYAAPKKEVVCRNVDIVTSVWVNPYLGEGSDVDTILGIPKIPRQMTLYKNVLYTLTFPDGKVEQKYFWGCDSKERPTFGGVCQRGKYSIKNPEVKIKWTGRTLNSDC